MTKIIAIAQKELMSYFRSPIAYILLVMMMTVFNIFFFIIIDQNQEASLRDIFKVMEFMFVFLIPLLTMKVFAEEKFTGTMEFLLTTPTQYSTIVLGKYLGSLIFFTLIVFLTGSYYFIIEIFGTPDRMAVFSGYAGIWLEGALFLAIGLLASSWTRHQIIAAISSYLILFMLYFAFSFIAYTDGIFEGVVRYISTMSHMENFISGILMSVDVIYYLSGTIFCLFIAIFCIKPEKQLLDFLKIVLAVILLCVVSYFSAQDTRRLDLTKSKHHTLSERTQHVLKNLKQDVKLTTFYNGLAPKYLEDLLKEYQRLSDGRIATEIIDPVVNIGYAAQFGKVINSGENKVIVQAGQKRKDIDFTENPLSEEKLTNEILRTTQGERTIYFLTGHGEYTIDEGKKDKGLATFKKLLAENNIISKSLMLGTQSEIPEDCDVLVIAGAQNHLLPKEVEVIKKYLARGGDALFLVEHVIVTTPDKPLTKEEENKNPSLNVILSDWGVKVANDVVVDLSSHASGDVGSPATRNYMAHKAIMQNLDYTFYVRPRSISLMPNRSPKLKIVPFVLTASEKDSWGETDRTLAVKFNEGVDRAGPVPIAFVIWEPQDVENDKPSDTRLMVFTDADFISNAYIGHYSNAEMGLNVINWLSELDYEVFINKKDVSIERLDLTSRQKKQVLWFLIAMPILIVLVGFGVNYRR
ncbi:Gliding motility-associated ABC transporter permease protein GldF [hydrothermal vent metagenome]|uniref:Gliding motility-associated ABC transporter permease protein GldF n=1 Tax=hydrothermal vent metagenome TaxID=652676 RepID=A0A3B1DX18_9ZZZZ